MKKINWKLVFIMAIIQAIFIVIVLLSVMDAPIAPWRKVVFGVLAMGVLNLFLLHSRSQK